MHRNCANKQPEKPTVITDCFRGLFTLNKARCKALKDFKKIALNRVGVWTQKQPSAPIIPHQNAKGTDKPTIIYIFYTENHLHKKLNFSNDCLYESSKVI